MSRDFFTMLCNSQWRAIKDSSLSEQKANDLPDHVTLILDIKLLLKMSYIIAKDVFGEVETHVCVIEFQKCGFPNAHYIFFIRKSSNVSLLKSNAVDSIIFAELSSSKNRTICVVSLKHNMHSPYAIFNPSSVSLIDGACSKTFQGNT